jgi:hypothetical protein
VAICTGEEQWAGYMGRDAGMSLFGDVPAGAHARVGDLLGEVLSMIEGDLRAVAMSDLHRYKIPASDLVYQATIVGEEDGKRSLTDREYAAVRSVGGRVGLDLQTRTRQAVAADPFPQSVVGEMERPAPPGMFRVLLFGFGILGTYEIPYVADTATPAGMA